MVQSALLQLANATLDGLNGKADASDLTAFSQSTTTALGGKVDGARATASELAAGTSASAGKAIPAIEDVPGIAYAAVTAANVALPQLMTRVERDSEGYFSIMSWVAPSKRYNLRNSVWNSDALTATTSTSVAAEIQSALNSGEDISFPPGCYPILNGVLAQSFEQRLRGAGRGNTKLFCPLGFDITSATILGLKNYGQVNDLTIDCYQPAGDAGQAAGGLVAWDGTGTRPANGIIPYPYAIDLTQCTRGRIDNLTLTRCWNGINATGNAGGCNFGRIEDGCLNRGLYVNNPADFFTIESYEGWVYGIAGTGLEQWVYTNPAHVYFGAADGLSVTSMNMWKRQIYYNNTSQLAASFGIVKLDGGNAVFVAQAGRAVIGALNALTDGGVPLQNSGAFLSIGAVDLKHADAATTITTPLIQQSGGRTLIGAGTIYGVGTTSEVTVSGGDMALMGVAFPGAAASSKPNGSVNQSGGRLRMHGCAAIDTTAATPGYFIYLGTNNHHSIVGNFYGARNGYQPASPIGAISLNTGINSLTTF